MGSVTLTAAITMVSLKQYRTEISSKYISYNDYKHTGSAYKRLDTRHGGSVYDGDISNMPVDMCYTAPRYNMNTSLILFLFC